MILHLLVVIVIKKIIKQKKSPLPNTSRKPLIILLLALLTGIPLLCNTCLTFLVTIEATLFLLAMTITD